MDSFLPTPAIRMSGAARAAGAAGAWAGAGRTALDHINSVESNKDSVARASVCATLPPWLPLISTLWVLLLV